MLQRDAKPSRLLATVHLCTRFHVGVQRESPPSRRTADPGETTNTLSQHPAALAALRTRLADRLHQELPAVEGGAVLGTWHDHVVQAK